MVSKVKMLNFASLFYTKMSSQNIINQVQWLITTCLSLDKYKLFQKYLKITNFIQVGSNSLGNYLPKIFFYDIQLTFIFNYYTN